MFDVASKSRGVLEICNSKGGGTHQDVAQQALARQGERMTKHALIIGGSMKKSGLIVTLFMLVLVTSCTPQQIPIATGSIRIAGAHDYLDSVQIQGNGSMRVYRRYSDVDVYCTSDAAVIGPESKAWTQ